MGTIEHPSYYNAGKIEVLDFIQDQKLPFALGNVVKYICRAGKKSEQTEYEDLQKAAYYLKRYMDFNFGLQSVIEQTPENERCRMMEQDSDPGRFNSATGK